MKELQSKSDLRGEKCNQTWEKPQNNLDTSVLGRQLSREPELPPRCSCPLTSQLLFLKRSGGKESGVCTAVSSDGFDTTVTWSCSNQTLCLPWCPRYGRCLTLQWGETELVAMMSTRDWLIKVSYWQENGLSVILNGCRHFHKCSWSAILEPHLCYLLCERDTFI